MTTEQKEHNHKWGLIVVHGVGDSSPGDTLDAVIQSMSDAKCAVTFEVQREEFRFPERRKQLRSPGYFKVVVRRGAAVDGVVLASEVSWADVTRVLPETHNLALDLFRIIFGLRHLIVRGSSQREMPSPLLSALYKSLIYLLQGPVFALLLLQGIMAVLYLGFVPPQLDIAPGDVRAEVALIGVYMVVACVAAWRWKSTLADPISCPWIWQWLVTVSVGASGVSFLRVLGWGESIYTQSLFPHSVNPNSVAVGDWVLSMRALDRLLDGFLSCVSLLLLACLCVVAVAHMRLNEDALRSVRMSFVAACAMVAFWELAIEPINALIQRAESAALREESPQYTVWFSDVCLAILVSSTVIAMAYILVRRMLWVRRSKAANVPRGEAERLIVGTPIQVAIGSSIIFYAVLEPIDAVVELRITYISYYLVNALCVVGAVFIMVFSNALRNVVHILADVVVHFEGPNANRLWPAKHPRYLTRRRISLRFRKALEMMLVEGVDRLVVIAHSQGSVIAIEGLAERRWLAHLSKLEQVTLVTLGSPFSHIYQEYFSGEYQSLAIGRWQRLQRTIKAWINVFRNDDYVGTKIDGVSSCFPVNLPFPAAGGLKGHTHYWQAEVLRSILHLLPGSARPEQFDMTLRPHIREGA